MSNVDFTPSAEQEALLVQFREATGCSDGQFNASNDLALRFLVARDWNVLNAINQYKATERWRQSAGVDSLRRTHRSYEAGERLRTHGKPLLAASGIELWPALRRGGRRLIQRGGGENKNIYVCI